MAQPKTLEESLRETPAEPPISPADDDALKAVMAFRGGRRYVAHQLSRLGLLDSVFVPDATSHAFNAGMRNAAVMIYADIMRVCPDLFFTMLNETKEDKENDDRIRNPTDPSSGGTGRSST